LKIPYRVFNTNKIIGNDKKEAQGKESPLGRSSTARGEGKGIAKPRRGLGEARGGKEGKG
jgi:hypothetical protein